MVWVVVYTTALPSGIHSQAAEGKAALPTHPCLRITATYDRCSQQKGLWRKTLEGPADHLFSCIADGEKGPPEEASGRDG